MRIRNLVVILAASLPALAEIQTGSALPCHVVRDWAQLPSGWNFGEVSAVDVDKDDNVWVFATSRDRIQRSGEMPQAWPAVPVKTPHGLRLDHDRNVRTVEVDAHRAMKWIPSGRLLLMMGGVGGAAGNNDSKGGFNRPAHLPMAPNGDFFAADGSIWCMMSLDAQGRVCVADRTNKRVKIFDQNGKFLGKWADVGSPFGLY